MDTTFGLATFCKGFQPIVEGILCVPENRGDILAGMLRHPTILARFLISLCPPITLRGRINPVLLPASLYALQSEKNTIAKQYYLGCSGQPFFIMTQRGKGQADRPLSRKAHTQRTHSSGGSFSFALEIFRINFRRGLSLCFITHPLSLG